MEKKFRLQTTSMTLHIMAMVFMLCDHLWGTIISGNDWLTCIGRLTFPIFAFMIVEGCFYTKNLKKYVLRLLIFAIISEIPFNLAVGGRLFYLLHQNVLWTFLITIGLIYLNELTKKIKRKWLRIIIGVIVGASSVAVGAVIGFITFVDYNAAGILTVLAFYFFRGRKWWCYIGQFVCLWYINLEILGGLEYPVALFGHEFAIAQQSFALLALIPIWLYRGKQGYHSKWLQYFYYAFYPAHLLILGLIKLFF